MAAIMFVCKSLFVILSILQVSSAQSTTVAQRSVLPINLAAFGLEGDNIITFSQRDYVSVQGFARYAGTIVLVEVFRAGFLIGQTRGIGGTTAGVLLEANHPGGVCWGAGAGTFPPFTPDIKPGDVVMATFFDNTYNSMVVPDAVTTSWALAGNQITVKGTLGPLTTRTFIQVRIVNVAMLADPTIAARDLRAVPSPTLLSFPVKGSKPPVESYKASLTFDTPANTFTVTFVFTTPDAALVAFTANPTLGDGPTSNAFASIDVQGNWLGLNIYEFGAIGGPYDVFCPPYATAVPTAVPTTAAPTPTPTAKPTAIPTATPTEKPSTIPSATPSAKPSATPTEKPTAIPSATPSAKPSAGPTTATPSTTPTTAFPSAKPSARPTATPSTAAPSVRPSARPTAAPTQRPSSAKPSARPTPKPTVKGVV